MSERTPHTVVIIGGNGMYGTWAKGETLTKAKAQFRREGGKLTLGYTVLEYFEGSTFEGVDQMGRVYWKGEEPTATEVKKQ